MVSSLAEGASACSRKGGVLHWASSWLLFCSPHSRQVVDLRSRHRFTPGTIPVFHSSRQILHVMSGLDALKRWPPMTHAGRCLNSRSALSINITATVASLTCSSSKSHCKPVILLTLLFEWKLKPNTIAASYGQITGLMFQFMGKSRTHESFTQIMTGFIPALLNTSRTIRRATESGCVTSQLVTRRLTVKWYSYFTI